MNEEKARQLIDTEQKQAELLAELRGSKVELRKILDMIVRGRAKLDLAGADTARTQFPAEAILDGSSWYGKQHS